MKSCKACGTETSSAVKGNEFIDELADLVISASCDRSQKINYVMRASSIMLQTSDGCATNYDRVLEVSGKVKQMLSHVEQMVKNYKKR